MNRLIATLSVTALLSGLAASTLRAADPLPATSPAYGTDGQLRLPADYREWIYLSSGLDMSYREGADAARMMGHSMFDNVFVDPASYDRFQQTGHWPEGTMLIMEARGAADHGSINRSGQFQTERMGVEAHVRDSKRSKGDGWAFYAFGEGQTTAAVIPEAAACYACHRQHGAVDTTFVQFYPTLLGLATDKGSLSAAYLAEQRAALKN